MAIKQLSIRLELPDDGRRDLGGRGVSLEETFVHKMYLLKLEISDSSSGFYKKLPSLFPYRGLRYPIHLIFLLLFVNPALPQEGIGVGTLPFEWSGQWGIYHRFGFPGWGTDFDEGLLFMDGNFAHWPMKYAFPFKDRSSPEKEEASVTSSLWYRKGDYSLDEFAFDIDFRDPDKRSTRFQALKRNFDDQYGLLGPSVYMGAGGTSQQNYRLLMSGMDDRGGRWRLASGYFKTTDTIPVLGKVFWEKGVSRLDRILTNGVAFSGKEGGLKYQFRTGVFSQRLKHRSVSDAPEWQADLFSLRLTGATDYSLNTTTHFFGRLVSKYSSISSDSLGNQSRVMISALAGLELEGNRFEQRAGLGGGFVSPDRGAIVFDASSKYHTRSLEIVAAFQQELHPMPFQFSAQPFLFVPDFIVPTKVPRLRPNSSAISQLRTVGKIGISHRTSRSKIESVYFVAQAAPHYYFEQQWMFEMPDIIVLTKKSSDRITGLFWRGKINYVRNWWLYGSGIWFGDNKKGWGNGVRHQGSIALTFQESLFRGHLDARVKVWTDFWIGRDRFVWDPVLNLGYYDYKDVYSQDASGIVSIQFKAIISSFEIAYTMTNLLYAGRFLVKDILYASASDESLSFVGTPLFPPAGRLAYLALRWNFKD